MVYKICKNERSTIINIITGILKIVLLLIGGVLLLGGGICVASNIVLALRNPFGFQILLYLGLLGVSSLVAWIGWKLAKYSKSIGQKNPDAESINSSSIIENSSNPHSNIKIDKTIVESHSDSGFNSRNEMRMVLIILFVGVILFVYIWNKSSVTTIIKVQPPPVQIIESDNQGQIPLKQAVPPIHSASSVK